MKSKESFTTASDGKKLKTRVWLPDTTPEAKLLVVHGMGEHSARYEQFATYLTDQNIAVIGYDHRGHGFTDSAQKGIVKSDDAYRLMTSDIELMRNTINNDFYDLPEFLFSHSMGSFLTMRHLQISSMPPPAGVIYSGSSGAVSPFLPFGIALSSIIKTVAGNTYRSEFLRNIVFKPYNDNFKPNRTRHDWISRDTEAVDRYVADPNCGFTPTASFLNHFFKGLRKTQKHRPFSGPHSYPVLIVAGSEDPISKPLNGIDRLNEKLKTSGITSLENFVYKDGRHEMLSEINRDQVMSDIGDWLERMLEEVKNRHTGLRSGISHSR